MHFLTAIAHSRLQDFPTARTSRSFVSFGVQFADRFDLPQQLDMWKASAQLCSGKYFVVNFRGDLKIFFIAFYGFILCWVVCVC